MPHVSKKDLSDDLKKRLFNQLFQTFKGAGKESVGILLSELLTSTEKVMLAKRLTAILLLDKELPQHIIAEELQISSSTVTRFSRDLDMGMYRRIAKMSYNRKDRALQLLVRLLLIATTPRVGRGRWKNIDHLFDS